MKFCVCVVEGGHECGWVCACGGGVVREGRGPIFWADHEVLYVRGVGVSGGVCVERCTGGAGWVCST